MILTLLLSIVLHVGDSLYVNESRICEEPDAQHMAVVERLDSVIEFKLFDLTDHAFYGWERFSAWDGRRFTRTGWQECFDKDGNLTSRDFYNRSGHREIREVYYENGGPVRLLYTYAKGQTELKQFYTSGSIKRHEVRRGNKVTGECYTESGALVKFTPFAVQPQFPGGKGAMYAYLDKSIVYPRQCRKSHTEGQTVVGFIVNKQGKTEKVEIYQSSGSDLLDEEALRIVREMPTWTPGMEDGQVTDTEQTVSVMFRIKK